MSSFCITMSGNKCSYMFLIFSFDHFKTDSYYLFFLMSTKCTYYVKVSVGETVYLWYYHFLAADVKLGV